MKKDRLYTVNRWNRPVLMQGNLFWNGGPTTSDLRWDRFASNKYGANYGNKGFTLDDYKNSKNWLGVSKKDNLFSKGNIGGTMQGIGLAAIDAAGQIGRSDSFKRGLWDRADPLHYVANGRESSLGNGVGDAGVETFKASAKAGNGIGMLVGAGLKVGGDLINAGWGMKTDKKAEENDKNAINYYKNYSAYGGPINTLAMGGDIYGGITPLVSMANFKDPYKGGWFTGDKARRKNETLRSQYEDAKNFAFNSYDNKVNNVNDDMVNNFLANYRPFGGPLEMMANNDGMGAIGYDLANTYLTLKKDQARNKGNMISYLGNIPSEPMTFAKGGGLSRDKNYGSPKKPYPSVKSNDFAGGDRSYPIPTKADAIDALRLAGLHGRSDVKTKVYRKYPELRKHGYGGLLDNRDTFFALGGDLQTNGGDYSTGLVHIDQGGSHEENPYDGVQMGIAPDNTPNLVEEGETIYADGGYVFSNRIHPKKEILKKFHMYSKGGKLTYADVSKRLEEEAKERPNDPISQASFKKMLEQLMDAQENQKAEEEAKRAREAFEALSPEEQQQVLAQIAVQQQQEAATQQQPTEQEVPVDESGNPVDASQMQQPTEDMAGQPTDESGIVGANGGKLNHKYDGVSEPSGKMQRKLTMNDVLRSLGYSSLYDLRNWAAKNKINKDWNNYDWNGFFTDKDLASQLAKDFPALTDAVSTGKYDLGVYTPDTSNLYNQQAFRDDTLANYDKSRRPGYTEGKYTIDKDLLNNYYGGKYKDAKALETSPEYQAYVKYAQDVANRAKGINLTLTDDGFTTDNGRLSKGDLDELYTLYRTSQNTKTATHNEPVQLFSKNGNTFTIMDDVADRLYKRNADGSTSGLMGDGDLGTFHLIPALRNRGKVTRARVINPDNTIEDVVDVPKEWGNPVNTYTWKTDDNDITWNYYKRPEAANSNNSDKGNNGGNGKKLGYLPTMSTLESIAPQLAGLSYLPFLKPDTSEFDAARRISGPVALASYKPIGNYMADSDMDIWPEQNLLTSRRNAANRTYSDSNAPVATKTVFQLANDYNADHALGSLYRQALEYNDARHQKVAEFNRGTDTQNANAYNQLSQFNADAINKNRQYNAQLASSIAGQKYDANMAWKTAPIGYLTSIGNVLNERDLQNRRGNILIAMANSNLAGTPTDELGVFATGKSPSTSTPPYRRGKSSANGGKLRKKRKGLTF